MIKQAIFLLAGKSSRFEGIVQHKCLLKICGQTLVERQIIQSANLGVRDFIFAVGAAHMAIQREIPYIFDGRKIPYHQISFIYNGEHEMTQNGYTLWLCHKYLIDGSTLIWEGDIVIRNLPLLPVERNIWFAVGGPCNESGSYIRGIEQGIFNESPGPDWMKSAGIFYVTGGEWPFFRFIKDSYKDKYVDEVIITRPFKTFVVNYDDWQEIDTVEDFRCAKKKFKEPIRFQPDPAIL